MNYYADYKRQQVTGRHFNTPQSYYSSDARLNNEHRNNLANVHSTYNEFGRYNYGHMNNPAYDNMHCSPMYANHLSSSKRPPRDVYHHHHHHHPHQYESNMGYYYNNHNNMNSQMINAYYNNNESYRKESSPSSNYWMNNGNSYPQQQQQQYYSPTNYGNSSPYYPTPPPSAPPMGNQNFFSSKCDSQNFDFDNTSNSSGGGGNKKEMSGGDCYSNFGESQQQQHASQELYSKSSSENLYGNEKKYFESSSSSSSSATTSVESTTKSHSTTNKFHNRTTIESEDYGIKDEKMEKFSCNMPKDVESLYKKSTSDSTEFTSHRKNRTREIEMASNDNFNKLNTEKNHLSSSLPDYPRDLAFYDDNPAYPEAENDYHQSQMSLFYDKKKFKNSSWMDFQKKARRHSLLDLKNVSPNDRKMSSSSSLAKKRKMRAEAKLTKKDDCKDMIPLPGFLQTFGQTEIGRFSEAFCTPSDSPYYNNSIESDDVDSPHMWEYDSLEGPIKMKTSIQICSPTASLDYGSPSNNFNELVCN